MTYKHWLFVGIILGIVALNYYYNNIVIVTMDYLSSLPKLIAIIITILFIIFPRFMEEADFTNFFSNNHFYKKKSSFSQKTKKIVAARQKWKCNKCKKLLEAKYYIYHLTPLDQGGTNLPDNLQALCRKCHISKIVN
jgi:hypothetical protein